MKKFEIIRNVTKVLGSQIWCIAAETEEEAISKHNKGEGEFLGEHIEVQGTEYESIEEIKEGS
jgi:hypothetical protein